MAASCCSRGGRRPLALMLSLCAAATVVRALRVPSPGLLRALRARPHPPAPSVPGAPHRAPRGLTQTRPGASLFPSSGSTPEGNNKGLGAASSFTPPMMAPPSMGLDGPRGMEGAELQEEMYEGVRLGPPPDLASLLLHNRIVYLGMPMVPAVTELIVAELLYLNYESSSQPVTLYINSPGTVTADGRSVGFETEAFAIADTMKYIKPPVHTICVGQAFGAAAMLLSQGAKGHRACLPNASIMLHQPRSMARGQASDIAIKAREVMINRKVQCEMIARACGKPVEVVMQDAARTKYLQPDEAVEYGLIDTVLRTEGKETLTMRPSFMSQV